MVLALVLLCLFGACAGLAFLSEVREAAFGVLSYHIIQQSPTRPMHSLFVAQRVAVSKTLT